MNPGLHDEFIHLFSLSNCQGVGCITGKILVAYCGSAKEVFTSSAAHLRKIPGISDRTISSIKAFKEFDVAAEELKFVEKHNINVHFFTDKKYPKRLLDAHDAPLLLFQSGDTDLNIMRVINIVGTRRYTEYGRSITEKLVEGLSHTGCLIVSGLAYGIDAAAHRACVANQVLTVGVLAHGLDRVYPFENKSLAVSMIRSGGSLLTEFPSKTIPDRENFPMRNRIVAAMCDATIVVETATKGGALITAQLAGGYNREVFAFPGRYNDEVSQGCNWLIKSNKASLIENADDLIKNLNWDLDVKVRNKKQLELVFELSEKENIVFKCIRELKQVHIDRIMQESNLPLSELALVLIELEMKSLIVSLPGKMYAAN